MALRLKKTEIVFPTQTLDNQRFNCTLENGIFQLDDESASTVGLFNVYGYGKGTLSRNLPDYLARCELGLLKASVDDPFVTPQRSMSTARSPSPTDHLASELASTHISESKSPEKYQFGWEEALYLESQICALSVRLSGMDLPLTSLELYSHLQHMDFNFPIRYYVYKHFRLAGWVVKLGTKVGVDFLLYPLGGPQRAHAQYGVLIQLANNFQSRCTHSIAWPASARVLDSIAKSLLVAMVTPDVQYGTEVCKTDFPDFCTWGLQELVLARWQSSDSTKTS